MTDDDKDDDDSLSNVDAGASTAQRWHWAGTGEGPDRSWGEGGRVKLEGPGTPMAVRRRRAPRARHTSPLAQARLASGASRSTPCRSGRPGDEMGPLGRPAEVLLCVWLLRVAALSPLSAPLSPLPPGLYYPIVPHFLHRQFARSLIHARLAAARAQSLIPGHRHFAALCHSTPRR
ncbi:hypothetical protein T440DRAFT_130255 [Plenodomus tracheiphilus IPT5]|uniref:Uncharacterized protein n=1 Tax=Plenodomus tracheiphilus IPT5 TaxID=1408161 RepID=A0A6A7B5H3_9PLEO|nr:hypothetical protein T440DRAFT_130255 [Plenodomus tracheiphilus IPT5]